MTDAEIVLRKLFDKILDDPYKNGTVTIKALTSGGANYTSSLYSITIAAKHVEDLKLFAKVANITGKLRDVINVKLLFDTEQFMYSDVAKIYEKLEEKHNVAPEYRFKFSKYYGGGGSEGEETVVFEDLVCQGYSPYNRFKVIDWEHIAVATESLARFHALSFAFQKEDPVNFAKALENVTFHPPEEDDLTVEDAWRKIAETAVKVTREEHKEAVSKFLLDKLSSEEVYKFKLPLGKPILCHGDYRVSNLLYRRQNGRLETIVLDYQTVHTGSAPVDLLYLEFMGTDEEFRRENHQRLIDHYYQELTLALERLGLDVNDVYPRETFDSELQQMLPIALRSASFILPMVLVEADRAPQLGNAEGGIEKVIVSPNELFAERFSALVSDCVRWGAI